MSRRPLGPGGHRLFAMLVGASFALTSGAMLSARQSLNHGQSGDGCAEALPALAETCQTLAALLQRTATGFGTPSTSRQVFSALTFEARTPRDPSRLDLLPLLTWDARATGFATSISSATCWVEGTNGSIMRCVFDFGSAQARAVDHADELRAVLHEIAPTEWHYAPGSRAVLFSDGLLVRASVHLVNFDAPDWVADSPNGRWRVLLSLGRLAAHNEVAKEHWVLAQP